MNNYSTIVLVLLFAPITLFASDRNEFLNNNCTSCHDSVTKSGRLDLTAMKWEPANTKAMAAWVKVYDRVNAGEMPPKKADQPKLEDRNQFTRELEKLLVAVEREHDAKEGRATRRRLNRMEYENSLRDLLNAPWLAVKETLPEDAIAHGYNKIGDALDVSHVQIARYMQAADDALRAVIAQQVNKPDLKITRYYARDQASFTRKMFYSVFNNAPERACFPVLGTAAQPKVRTGEEAMTVGAKDPATRELEGVGLVCGAYEPVEPKFNNFKAPYSGRYKIRVNGLTVWVGPNGHQNNTKQPKWFIPDFDNIAKGRRSEPVTLYAETPPRQLRRIGSFDLTPDGNTAELEVDLLAGETIRPDASRLFRSRPGDVRFQNPLAEQDGQPGVVYRWLEVEGPILTQWPLLGHQLLFADLPIKNGKGRVDVIPNNAEADAKHLLKRFTQRAYRRPVGEAEALRFYPVIQKQLQNKASFLDAMLAGYTAVLCSPEFVTVVESPGKLDDYAIAARLALFLWNSEPDEELRALAAKGELKNKNILKQQTERMLNHPKSQRFTNAFLDYWLDLRKLLNNSPDATLYNDYYLDDWLTDSALEETQAYFQELVKGNHPSTTLVHSDFVTINERLARHYGIPDVQGTGIRKVKVPINSVRGGLLTQASVLTVTANGTTTSPVLRGAWIMERILGQPSPPPPPVPAVEPDLRGTTTIREQLAKHRDQASCAACHNNIDPPGFALESFDVMGGYRERYRAVADKGKNEKGLGVNGQPFGFRYGLPVDTKGNLPDGRTFSDIKDFKQLLLKNEIQIARNLARQLTIYATGADIRFSDRERIETMLKQTETNHYGVRDLIHAVVQSELFLNK